MSGYAPAGAEGPIGVFDSGLGGLTAVRQLKKILPGEDIVYFGDTGRVPYGTRGRDIIISYTRQDIAFLLSKQVKCILAACNTVSSTFPQNEADSLPVPHMEVVAPSAAAAAKATRTGRIGVIGTEATRTSGSYQRALDAISPGMVSIVQSCPLFVPLVENGHFAPDDTLAHLAALEYLEPLKDADIDTLVLGCTHYPLLRDTIAQIMGPRVALVDSGAEAALALKARLRQMGLLKPPAGEKGRCSYYVSDDPVRFTQLAGIFMGNESIEQATWVGIEKYSLDWILKGWIPGVE